MRPSKFRTAVLGALALVIAVLAPALPAFAQPSQVARVVVLSFVGWRADETRQMLIEEIAPFVELVDEERAVHTAVELGVDVSTPEGLQEVVEHLGVTLVVAGEVTGRRADSAVVIVVVNSAGDELSREVGPAAIDENRAEIGAAAVRAIEAAQLVLRERAAPQEPDLPPEEDDPGQRDEPPDDEVDPPAPPPIAWRQPYVLVLAGLRVRNVSTRIEREGGGLPFAFSADAYPEIDVLGVVRPLAAATDAARGLLLGLEFSFSVGIAYVGADGTARTMTSAHMRLDVGYGYVLGDIFELVGMIGFGVDSVLLEGADGFPSVNYSYLRPAIAGRLRAVPDLFLVEVGVGGRIGLDGADLGGAYGPGMSFGGVDVYGGVSGIVAPGFAWAARFGYVHHALGFDGTGGVRGDGSSGQDAAVEGRFLVGGAY